MRKLAAFSLALVVAAAACGVVSAKGVKIGEAAPDFTAKSIDGKTVTLKSALKGAEAVVVCFTCNNCPVAVSYEDRFIEFNKKYEGKKVTFIALNCNNASENLEQMKQRAEEKGFNFIYAFDASGDAARAYGASRTPEMYVVDSDGKVQYHGSYDDSQRNPTKTYLISAVDSVLAGETPAVTETKAFGCGINLKR